MKILPIILPVIAVCGMLSAQSEWKTLEHEGRSILTHEWDAKGKEAPSVDGLAKILASRDQNLPLSHITFWTYFNNDPTLQAELLTEFKSRYPDILAAALKSSGNMHNPKVTPLASKISECLLATPTLTKINKILRTHGYEITKISHEKFWINKDSKETPFHAIMWLIPEQLVKKDMLPTDGQITATEMRPLDPNSPDIVGQFHRIGLPKYTDIEMQIIARAQKLQDKQTATFNKIEIGKSVFEYPGLIALGAIRHHQGGRIPYTLTIGIRPHLSVFAGSFCEYRIKIDNKGIVLSKSKVLYSWDEATPGR